MPRQARARFEGRRKKLLIATSVLFGRWWRDENESYGDTDCPDCLHLSQKDADDCLTCLGTGAVYYSGRAEDVVGREQWSDVQLTVFLIHATVERGWAPDEFLRQPAKWVSAYFAVAGSVLQEIERRRETKVVNHGEFSAGRNQA